jgi:hypothetical protein
MKVKQLTLLEQTVVVAERVVVVLDKQILVVLDINHQGTVFYVHHHPLP